MVTFETAFGTPASTNGLSSNIALPSNGSAGTGDASLLPRSVLGQVRPNPNPRPGANASKKTRTNVFNVTAYQPVFESYAFADHVPNFDIFVLNIKFINAVIGAILALRRPLSN